MTLNEIEHEMPNGFHDSFLKGVRVDYISRQAELDLELWVGSMDKKGADREAYRHAHVVFTGLLLCIVEVPNQNYIDEMTLGLSFDIAEEDFNNFSKVGWPSNPLPANAFLRSFYFAEDYDSFIHIAATGVELHWQSKAREIY